jgi:hypothetical protein
MKFSLKYDAKKNDFAEAMGALADPISKAGTEAIKAAGEIAKTEGRKSIGAAGFSKRWENTLRSDAYPGKKKNSLNAATAIFHKIPYADVFESGATVRGSPTLWVPFSSTPTKRTSQNDRKQFTPKKFIRQVAPLFPLPSRNGKKILAAQMAVSKSAAKRGPPYKPTLAGLRRGAAGQGITVSIPIFFGIDQLSIRKKFNITKAVDDAAAQLPQLYLRFLKAD